MNDPFVLKKDLLWLQSWMDQNPSLCSGFSTLIGGNQIGDLKGLNVAYHVGDDPKNVLNNRRYLANKLQMPLDQWVFCEQLHTTDIYKVTNSDLGAGVYDFKSGIPATDGLYTTESNIVLATFYADCTPLYFYAPNHHLVGVAHAGWSGTVNGIMHKMLQALKETEKIKPEDILVAIGPSIGRNVYQVDDRVINNVMKSKVLNVNDTYDDVGGGQYKFDAKLLNYKQALHEGIPTENILVSSYCTYTQRDLFYSHRRDTKTGRMLSFICLKD